MVETLDGRTRRRLATRERLYEAAVALITERGYEVATFDDIAARAGTSRRSCFNHFASKSDISLEWARRRRARAAEAVRAASPQGPLDGLRVYFHELAVVTEDRPVETREMLLGFLYAGGPVFHRTPMAQELRAWLADESPETVTRLDVAAEILYDVYLGVLWRWIRDDSPPPGAFLRELDVAVDLVIRGLAGSFVDH
ncbi:TetR/AcrR family transcriptional regulator [Actinomycetospora termitidis]|uniref:TetR/AcrR family transcriptional regulator n=1 Tax=Actinomycetospora termitidis TaxID=3053470 RepID=A0ABT7MG81_9PSEU|nr:TetR/AcrR family transcriptional regulator [Actinomycetospora sp. Odt1-22]MDL5159665.1 TetR/AcrR family transcriptional regulator [Actinomycetospora sp. Odt1-22]